MNQPPGPGRPGFGLGGPFQGPGMPFMPFMPPGMMMPGMPGMGGRPMNTFPQHMGGPPQHMGGPQMGGPPQMMSGAIMTPSRGGMGSGMPMMGPGMIASVKRAAAGMAGMPHTVEKSTMVSVGKIAPSVDSKAMLQLLESVGSVKSWKRAEDPETKVPKGFGFCEYQDVEGVLRAIRLLDGLKVDGQELVIKGNSATQRYVEQHEQEKARERSVAAAARVAAARKKHEEGEVVDEGALLLEASQRVATEEQDADNKALETIMSIVSEREEEAARRAPPPQSSAAADFLAKMERGELQLPPPPARGPGDLPADPSSSRGRDKERDRERDQRDRERDRDKDRDRERDRERDKERDKEREAEREYDARLREWERHEKLRADTRERERQRMDAAEKERLRACRADLDVSDSDDGMAPWERKPYRASRRCAERRRWRLVEEETDALDRQREQRELEAGAMERKRRRLASEQDQDAASGAGLGASGARQGGSEIKAEPSEVSAPSRHSPEVDETDPIYKAMMAAASSAPRGASSGAYATRRPGDGLLHAVQHDPHQVVKAEHRSAMAHSESPPPSGTTAATSSAAAAAAAGKAPLHFGRGRPSTLSNMFGDDEDGSSKRKLKPIKYSADEIKAVEEIKKERDAAVEAEASAAVAAETATSAAAVAAVHAASQADPKATLKSLMDRIPTTVEGVWSYPIKWQMYSAVMGQKFGQWVDAKVKQLLGASEPSVVSFIMELIGASKSPAEAAAELEPLLDTDTRTFVLKLYRTVIFETERSALGL
eukprot:CAMPEP_0119104138 /NCGR_PEP_ID=MMETSP1180-20130426/2429_1 /TAXON_ID=3052 ORGANISM="Chlamydomonas cf sp, Strain CCMP681" /NCGR_SAMPLE_ID=MMETSP1180 /ASSEMBLY_ACC=CAM_ASM_000741 /LENGTH=774 /DNA_ID=CAMNT_0007088819 /DNA_START=12 /DNA_END=2336 /DNA_ORIENTATION=-